MKEFYDGVILAGGKGKRLMPLTAKVPKPLLVVGKKCPLERCISALQNAGVSNIAITVGHLHKKIENSNCAFKYSFENGMKIEYFAENSPMGTAGMVIKLLPFLSDDFFVLSGDVIFDISLNEMMKFHKEQNAAVTLAAVSSNNPTEYGTVVVKDNKVIAFREKPSWKDVISTKINTGLYIINRKKFENYADNSKDFATDIFPRLLKSKETIAVYESDGYWCDVGTPESYLECNMHFSNGQNLIGDFINISKNSSISKSVVMNGTKVGENTQISNSVIGEGVSIGKNCKINNAFIGDDALICDGATVEGNVPADTIIGKNHSKCEKKQISDFFCDSGLIFIENGNVAKEEMLQKSLAFLSIDSDKPQNPVFFFHAGDANSHFKASKLCEEILNSGGKATLPEESFPFMASFIAARKGCFSVFIKHREDLQGTFYTIYDPNGLPLSREDQIKMLKHDVLSKVKRVSNKDVLHTENLYINEKCRLIKELIKEKKNENSPEEKILSVPKSRIPFISSLIQSAGLLSVYITSETLFLNDKDSFFINNDGDIYAITKSGQRLDKMHLLAILFSNLPPKAIPLPDFFPKTLLNLISESKGTYHLYNDSIRGRVPDTGIYSYNDAVSIALSLLFVCEAKGISLDEFILEPFHFEEKSLDFSGNKKDVLNLFLEKECKGSIDGIHFSKESGNISIIPQYGKAFKIFAEAVSAEAAQELIAQTEQKILPLYSQD